MHLTHCLLLLKWAGLTTAGRAMLEQACSHASSGCKGSVHSSSGAHHLGTRHFRAMLRTKKCEASSAATFSFLKWQQQTPCLWYEWTRDTHLCGEGNEASPTPFSSLWVGVWHGAEKHGASQAVLQSMHTCRGRISPHSAERPASQNPGVYQSSRTVQCVPGWDVHSLSSQEVLKASYNIVAAPSTNQRGGKNLLKEKVFVQTGNHNSHRDFC